MDNKCVPSELLLITVSGGEKTNFKKLNFILTNQIDDNTKYQTVTKQAENAQIGIARMAQHTHRTVSFED